MLVDSTPVLDRRPPVASTRPHHVVMLVLGVILAGAGLMVSGIATPLVIAVTQRGDDGFVMTPTERYSVDSSAITAENLHVLMDKSGPRSVANARFTLRVTPTGTSGPVFVGVGPQADVDAYLKGVAHSQLTQVRLRPFRPTYQEAGGSRKPALPTEQTFWAVSAAGPGTQQITTDLRTGEWAVVIMNADGSRPVAIDMSAGARWSYLTPVTIVSSILGVLMLAGGVVLIAVGASRLGRTAGGGSNAAGSSALTSRPVPLSSAAPSVISDPAHLQGALDPALSRWLWLVKWLLAFPHYLVLIFLWTGTIVTSLMAGVAILVTGRYPRSLFHFNVGVLRWTWRVGFYSYGALGTDRYPPFTLARTDYPADFDVTYPDHLSRGLVLVKSWLLALPQLVIVALMTSAAPYWWSVRGDVLDSTPTGAQISLLGALVTVAGVLVLFTGRYPRGLFDLVMGINRWLFRVITYVALMRDEYPPFRLDQGSSEPSVTPDAPSEPTPPAEIATPKPV